MKTMTGAELALWAGKMADSELEEAKTLLRVRAIPHVLDSIWECGESTRNSNYRRKPLNTGAIAELSRLAVTFPGSSALTPIHQVLDQQGIDAKVAEAFVEEFAKLSREPLAVLNHYRHVRTSLNIYLKALVIGWDEREVAQQSTLSTLNVIKSRVTPFIILDPEIEFSLGQKSNELSVRNLSGSKNIDE